RCAAVTQTQICPGTPPAVLRGGDARTESESRVRYELPGKASGDCGGQRRGWTADEAAQVPRGRVEYVVAGRLRVGVSDVEGESGWQTHTLEHGLVGLLRH